MLSGAAMGALAEMAASEANTVKRVTMERMSICSALC